jgi:hypothetical protein
MEIGPVINAGAKFGLEDASKTQRPLPEEFDVALTYPDLST